jgi:UDP-3-O-[3-hydroxymyristoyl] N-acetylglucosamine deacetylase
MQTTIEKPFTVEGIGVHTGSYARMIVNPAPVDTGIVFRREGVTIPARVENVNDTGHGVTLKVNGKSVRTCEHILSALSGLDIDNAECIVEGEEIPALDGSSKEFIDLIKRKPQSGKSKVHEIKEPIFVESSSASLFAIPCEEFKISFLVDYSHPGIKTQCKTLTITPETYCSEIARARTYTFTDWIDGLKEKKLIQGGNLDNAVVIGKEGPLNDVRFEDEQVRHKILDLIGDLALLGVRIRGWVFAIKSGHTLNTELVRRLRNEL